MKSNRIWLSLVLPVSVSILACFGLIKMNTLPVWVNELVPWVPYLLLLLTGLLAYRFNQSNIFYLAVLFLLVHSLLDSNLKLADLSRTHPDLIYSLTVIAVPLNLLLFGSLQERGIISQWGLLKLIFIISELAGAAWLIRSTPTGIMSLLNAGSTAWTIAGVAPLSILVLGISILVCLVKLRLKGSFFDATAVGMLVSLIWLMYYRHIPAAPAMFTSSLGLLMIIYIIQSTYSMAYLDELTEIPGRRAMHDEMMKLSGTFAVAIADIDFFKKFNDNYGHEVGDQLLRMVAARLKQITGGGKAFRYGGEEFVVIFPGKKMDDVLPHLDKVRQQIAQTGFAIRGKDRPKKKPKKIKPAQKVKRVSVTISIGVAEKSPVCKTPQEVLAAADKALYRAKNSGRNRVCKG
ncbi:MAG TPA: GGDEF domain-containing protein [Syntrophomonadaceae bacterium]|nr:GGDEF domain-containing protein [Syntrophomonadaceae bacterium]HQE22920.1 GGDEF domain-containing protein [Syntrophomonadaceae bacterium]